MARVRLKNVNKQIGTNPIIKNVSLDVRDRELFVLVGPSGCGKSTILRMIAGLEPVTSGQILIDGKVVNDVPSKDRNIAMVFQNYALYPHMTVYENMAFGLRIRDYSKKEIDSRVQEAAEVLDIRPLLKRKPSEISGGQKQRVAVGRAIIRKPKVFLFDEPLSNLDAKLRVQMRAEILQLHQHLQTTIIYVTHDQVEAMTLGNRLCVLKGGVIQQVSGPLDVYRTPENKFVAEFVGSPSMNFFPVTVIEKNNSFWLDQGQFQLKLHPRYKLGCPLKNGQRVIVGVRPEDIHDRLFQPGASGEGNSLLAIVQFLEPIGSETFVHVDARGIRLVARVDSSNPVQKNQPIELVFNMEKIHLFSESGQDRLPLEV